MESGLIPLVIAIIALIFIIRTLKIVPQQHAWVVERLGKYDRTLTPGLSFVVPFVERVAYKHSLKEVPLDVPSQVCITKDNTQLQVDGIIYFQVTDPMRASYGSSNYVFAITQLAQTLLRSVIGKMELDKTFEERDVINAAVVNALDEAALNWGVKVLRYEIKDLTPPAEILRAMQAQITAEREKRALIAASEGRRQEQINIATGQREAAIARSEGERQSDINKAQGEAAAIVAVATATAGAMPAWPRDWGSFHIDTDIHMRPAPDTFDSPHHLGQIDAIDRLDLLDPLDRLDPLDSRHAFGAERAVDPVVGSFRAFRFEG